MMSSAVWLFVSGFISLNMCLFSVARWTGSRRNKHLNSDRKRFIIFWKPQESCCLSSLFGTQVHLDVSELRHTKSRLIPESSLRIQFHFEVSASNVPAPKRLSYRHNYTTNLHQMSKNNMTFFFVFAELSQMFTPRQIWIFLLQVTVCFILLLTSGWNIR